MLNTKIEWFDATWNPVTGCRHDCPYCYARRMAQRFAGYDPCYSAGVTGLSNGCFDLGEKERKYKYITGSDGKPGRKAAAPYPFGFEPTLHRYRLNQPKKWKDPQTIFVCSMADLFGAWVPDEWIQAVFKACEQAPHHRYLFLTKNPTRYMKLAQAGKLPERDNFWYGSTTTGPDDMFWWSDYHNTFASVEPMLEEIQSVGDCPVKKVGWVIMGAMTGPGSKEHQPKKEWIESMVEDADAIAAPVFMKDSLIPIVGEENMRRELPWMEAKNGT